MRRKRANGTAAVSFKPRGNTPLKSVKPAEKLSKAPAGKGLGKAGAKRLGRMLKRAIQPQEEPSGRGKVFLPKTPVRLLKHQIETNTKNGPRTNSSKLAWPQVSKLILSLVSQCKHRAGISMAELKQTLAAEGYDVSKNNRQVSMVTKRMVGNGTLVRTTRNTSFRLSKTLMETKQVKKTSVTHKPKAELKKSYAASKSSKGAERSQGRNQKTSKPRGKLQKPKGKTNRAAAPKKQPIKTRKPAAKSQKQSRQTPRWKKARSTKNRAARPRKPPKKAQRTQRRQTKRDKHPYKSPRRQQRHKTSPTFKSHCRRTTRRNTYNR
ncbi:histone H1 isoform X2 [Kryptolebias marmoratus]|uniref:histone H1 isoform X2 n=1 Tax=Kryptolebias marmoratus TaxID=37003 RepID=UPI0007F908C1|nr:histone H1 isoform X2 [Kryptolebias marmoratus]